MKTVVEVLKLSTSYLQDRKIEKSRRMAEDLLASVLKMKRIDLYLLHDRPVDEEELEQLRGMLRRAAKGEPVAYIVGEVEFYDCTIRTDSRALIPRPETEILVDLISKNVSGTVWDVCTGSGCIGIALKKARPDLSVTLSDISPQALALAEENARLNGVEVSFFQGDLFHPFSGKSADLIVCNPPYVTPTEYLSLDPSVRDFEPKLALVGEMDGLEYYLRIAAEIGPFLRPNGQLWLEIGHAQGGSVNKIFNSTAWKKLTLIQDWSGKDRYLSLEK